MELREAVRPEGETDRESDTEPEKPLRLARLIVDVPEVADWIVRLEGLAETVKSGVGEVTVTETMVEWTREPLVPVTVTV